MWICCAMAAVAAGKDDAMFIFESVVHGHHTYKKSLDSYDRGNPWFGVRTIKRSRLACCVLNKKRDSRQPGTKTVE